MNFKEYSEFVETMPLFDDPLLGLVEEVGEVVQLFKKDRRPEASGFRKPMDKERLMEECGDVLWYLDTVARTNGFSLEEAAIYNKNKLSKRHSK